MPRAVTTHVDEIIKLTYNPNEPVLVVVLGFRRVDSMRLKHVRTLLFFSAALCALAALAAPGYARDYIKQFSWTGHLESGKYFWVNFDYRLDSAPEATLRLFFWTPVPRDPQAPEEATCVGEVKVKRGEGRGHIQCYVDPVWSRTAFSRVLEGVGFEFSLVMGKISSGRFVLLIEGVPTELKPWPEEKLPPPPVKKQVSRPPASDDMNINVNVHVYIHHDGEVAPEYPYPGREGCEFDLRELKPAGTTLYDYLIKLDSSACPRRPEPVIDEEFIPYPFDSNCPPKGKPAWDSDKKAPVKTGIVVPDKKAPVPAPGKPSPVPSGKPPASLPVTDPCGCP